MRKILDFLRDDLVKIRPLKILGYLGGTVALLVFWAGSIDSRDSYVEAQYHEELSRVQRLQERADFDHLQAIMDLSVEFHFDPTIVMLVDHHSRLNVDRNEPAWSIVKTHEMMTHITLSLIDIESNGNTFAKSNKNAYGLTQFLLPTARDYVPDVTVNDLYDQETNIRIFFMHFERLLEKYDGNVTKVLDAWNRGEGTVDKLLAKNVNPANGYSDAIYKVALANNRSRIGY
jgi:hypothetical protein